LKNFSLIDLSHHLDPSIPSFNGSCGFEMSLKADYDKGVRIYSYKCHAGIGTHMDSPSHFIPGGLNIGDIPLEDCLAPLYIINCSDKAHPDFFLSAEDIQSFEKEFEEIEKGAFVVMRSGWESKWSDNEKYRNVQKDNHMHFPGFSSESVQYLLEKEIKGIGIDTLSPDGSSKDFPVHHLVLGKGKYIVENLCNLSKVPPYGAYILNAPTKVKKGTEAFVRSIAFIDKSKKS
jgi:kynurenine formamidase